MTTNQPRTFHVVLAPLSPADPEFTEQFGLHKVDVQAVNRDQAIMIAAIRSGIADFECGDFIVRSVEAEDELGGPGEARALREVREVRCEFVHGDLSMIECARNGCNLCGGELDIAGEDF